jgi:hypothetical protein
LAHANVKKFAGGGLRSFRLAVARRECGIPCSQRIATPAAARGQDRAFVRAIIDGDEPEAFEHERCGER